MNDKSVHICNWCNQPSVLIWVHGHFQCSVCGINVDECCRGEEAYPPNSPLPVRRSFNEDVREGEKDKND